MHPDYRCRGIGSALVERSLEDAKRLGHRAVLLVGDAPYYGRFGFSAEATGSLWLPGRYDANRFLAHELQPGALANAPASSAPPDGSSPSLTSPHWSHAPIQHPCRARGVTTSCLGVADMNALTRMTEATSCTRNSPGRSS